jgi:hypothetical protein
LFVGVRHQRPIFLGAAIAIGAGCLILGACDGRRYSTDAADAATGDTGAEGPIVCSVSAPTACPTPAPHYPDIAPIVRERCVPCHYGAVLGPWPLTTYKHVADWYDIIPAALLDCSMPPPDAGVPMTNQERLAILTWLRCGFPE